ncbi:MAG: sulfatase [Planctomycetota bacterium]
MTWRHTADVRTAALPVAAAALIAIGGAPRAHPEVSTSSHAAGTVTHVCFLFMEDMGLQIGPYGDDTVPTPNLDRLASEGVVFESAYCTSATCSPSRSSIFTGLYPHQNGHYGLASNPHKPEKSQWGFRLHEGVPTLTPMLREAGFATAYTYKLHVGPEETIPFDRSYRWEDFNSAGSALSDGTQVAAFMRQFHAEYVDDESPRMFFMAQSTDTHRPFAWESGGHNKPLQFSGSPYQIMTADHGLTLPYFGPDIPQDPGLLNDVADYYNAIQRVDKVVGETLDALDEMGIADDTLVIFSADHGPPFTRGKVSVYELGAHVPLLVRWPDVSTPGLRSDHPVSLVDFMPTVLDAVGLEIPEHMAGRSWRPLLDGGDDPDRSPYAVSEFHAHMTVNTYWPSRTITDGRWKLNLHMLAGRGQGGGVVTDNPPDLRVGRRAPAGSISRGIYDRFDDPPRYELFDLRTDPYEWHDLSTDPAYAETKQRLIEALEQWQYETADPFADESFLDAFTAHYRETENAAKQWSEENGRPFWQQPRLLDGDQTRWLRQWDEVVAELRSARTGRSHTTEAPQP